MAIDPHDDAPIPTPAPRSDAEVERAMREAEDLALVASGLGSGLLAQQTPPDDSETVAVLKVCPQCATEYETAARFCPADGTALRPKGTDSLIGRVLADRYHILKRIGEGGMGRVYLGEHVKMNRQCAIKVMSPVLVNDHDSAARFAREASNAARIIHPNVAAVFDYGESDGLVYLVMEYVEGQPLSHLLAYEAPFEVDRALDLARQIADGLGAAHELGIVHRDLKPDNILVTRNRAGKEVAKVVDFGIAKAMQESAGEALTRTGLVIGTPEFMSPEQLLGDPIDARSDLYALACILHLMLTGTPTFEAPTREQMIKRRLSEDAPHVQRLDPGLPDSLDQVVARMLARSPDDRYHSAAEVRDALSGPHARREGLSAAARRNTPRSIPTQAFETSPNATTQITPIAAGTRRRASLLIGAAALLALGGTIVLRNARANDMAARAAVQRDSIAHEQAVVVAEADSTVAAAPAPKIDSALIKAQEAQRRQQDSVRNAAIAETTAVRAAIVRYAKAIESGDVEKLRAAYPALSQHQQEFWQKNVFAIAERIKAGVRYGATTVVKDTAQADFSLRLSFVSKPSKQEETRVLSQRGTLVRQGTGWRLSSVR
jgi:serine/threonine-protein kinase